MMSRPPSAYPPPGYPSNYRDPMYATGGYPLAPPVTPTPHGYASGSSTPAGARSPSRNMRPRQPMNPDTSSWVYNNYAMPSSTYASPAPSVMSYATVGGASVMGGDAMSVMSELEGVTPALTELQPVVYPCASTSTCENTDPAAIQATIDAIQRSINCIQAGDYRVIRDLHFFLRKPFAPIVVVPFEEKKKLIYTLLSKLTSKENDHQMIMHVVACIYYVCDESSTECRAFLLSTLRQHNLYDQVMTHLRSAITDRSAMKVVSLIKMLTRDKWNQDSVWFFQRLLTDANTFWKIFECVCMCQTDSSLELLLTFLIRANSLKSHLNYQAIHVYQVGYAIAQGKQGEGVIIRLLRKLMQGAEVQLDSAIRVAHFLMKPPMNRVENDNTSEIQRWFISTRIIAMMARCIEVLAPKIPSDLSNAISLDRKRVDALDRAILLLATYAHLIEIPLDDLKYAITMVTLNLLLIHTDKMRHTVIGFCYHSKRTGRDDILELMIEKNMVDYSCYLLEIYGTPHYLSSNENSFKDALYTIDYALIMLNDFINLGQQELPAYEERWNVYHKSGIVKRLVTSNLAWQSILNIIVSCEMTMKTKAIKVLISAWTMPFSLSQSKCNILSSFDSRRQNVASAVLNGIDEVLRLNFPRYSQAPQVVCPSLQSTQYEVDKRLRSFLISAFSLIELIFSDEFMGGCVTLCARTHSEFFPLNILFNLSYDPSTEDLILKILQCCNHLKEDSEIITRWLSYKERFMDLSNSANTQIGNLAQDIHSRLPLDPYNDNPMSFVFSNREC